MDTGKYVVRCEDWASAPLTHEQATRTLSKISQSGICTLDHRIVPTTQEVPMKT